MAAGCWDTRSNSFIRKDESSVTREMTRKYTAVEATLRTHVSALGLRFLTVLVRDRDPQNVESSQSCRLDLI